MNRKLERGTEVQKLLMQVNLFFEIELHILY